MSQPWYSQETGFSPRGKIYLALGIAGLCLILAGVALTMRKVNGQPIGGPCHTRNECSEIIDSYCLQARPQPYCTHWCEGPPDCPPGWGCEPPTFSSGDYKHKVCTRR
jgi:hypothetical protein